MPFFEEAKMSQAYAKIGMLGFAGAGKTFTAGLIIIGLYKMLKSKKPVFFIDTETGSDFMVGKFAKEGVPLKVAKQRAFKNLISMCQEAEKQTDILVIDSISAFWIDLMESYKKKKNRNFISFPDWGILKKEWRKFTDWYINSSVHCIICGRAGWVYNEWKDEDGQAKLEKTGTKMKAETEFGYEPSLLIEMERVQKDGEGSKIGQLIIHRAHILKDRTDILDGKSIDNPTFKDFLPAIQPLNLGGEHFALDTKTTSEEMFDEEGKPDWKRDQEQKTITLEEISGMVNTQFPSASGKEKVAKLSLFQFVFKTRSGKALEEKSLKELQIGRDKIEFILSVKENIKTLLSDHPEEHFDKLKVPEEPPVELNEKAGEV